MLVLIWLLLSDPFQQAVEVRRHLHRNPELSNRETQTQAYLMDQLRALGIGEPQPLAKTGIKLVVDQGRPGRVLAFRADMDALPIQENTGLSFQSDRTGVMHACGHDIHTAILFGLACELARREVPGTIVLMFQPAEEGAPPGEIGGASLMVQEGALQEPRPDVMFGLHLEPGLPKSVVATAPGGLMARADRFFVEIHGEQTHGARPQLGIDALVTAAHVVTAAQSIVSREVPPHIPAVVTFGTFSAGNRFNIIPGTAQLTGTIRTLDRELGEALPQKLERVIAGICQSHGATYTFRNDPLTPVTFNDPQWTDRVMSALPRIQHAESTMVAEDFGFFAEVVPAVYFFLGTCEQTPCASIHTDRFNPPESVIQTGIDLWVSLIEQFGNSE
ncbi:MAG: amidohydrolase [Acidobacteria bacterium]|nr:amidohydrolase [Acidobacteriota bacterium]